MANYIDGFVLPIPQKHLDTYKQVAETVSKIWKEHGALAYHEFVCDDMHLEGTLSFTEAHKANKDEIIIFGWVEFSSREDRDHINEKVATDSRMPDLIAPLVDPERVIFEANRMAFGGFRSLV